MVNIPKFTGKTWLNSNPLTIDDYKGKVVVFDFWTYSCVNCIRTMPHLREWWAEYKDNPNFVMVGIHTPEFEFEKKQENVEQAIKDLEISWPVVMDNDQTIWNAFANRYWPAKYIADKNGKIVYSHFGEGAYEETEAKIIELLGGETSESKKQEHQHNENCFRPTPETYSGYQRGRLTSAQEYQQDKTFSYVQPKNIDEDSIALTGEVMVGKEYVELASVNSSLLLNFKATEVNLVIHPGSEQTKLQVTLDGEQLPGDIKGDDVSTEGHILIEKPTLYNLISANRKVAGILKITSIEGKAQAYAFTFSGCIREDSK